ncbi:hypothetical protein A2U01_0012573, partial [Trifolium medium]|nr:hypothetical protein [Trifolium medium]
PKVRKQHNLEGMKAHAFTSLFVTPESIASLRKGRLLGFGMDEAEIIVEAVVDNEPVNLVWPPGTSCIPTVGPSSGPSKYCVGLKVEPSVPIFFSFYQIRGIEPNKWVSISAQTNRARFIPFTSNFKNFKDAYFHVRHGTNGRELMYAKGEDTTLDSILRKMSRATDAQWKAHLAAARR